MGDSESRSGRDTRLLALVIVISLAVLLILARFRFPAADLTTAPTTPGALERLVAQTTYEGLASNVSSVLQRATPAVVVFELHAASAPAEEPPARGTTGRSAGPPEPVAPVAPPRLVPGVRVASDLALVHVPAGFIVAAAVSYPSVETVATDADRGVALVRLPPSADAAAVPAVAAGFAGFGYVAVIEAAVGGPTAKPVFIGRVDAAPDTRWNGDLLVIGGTPDAPVGSLVFSLDGRFVGLAVATSAGGAALVSFGLLESAASALLEPGKGLGP